ncbi:hypothetical protein HDU93_008549 [Gonapodya sp. JEL0774]|nr:hypothetical protein HDU93_008549 [Gonapodya sp. JEL0774]
MGGSKQKKLKRDAKLQAAALARKAKAERAAANKKASRSLAKEEGNVTSIEHEGHSDEQLPESFIEPIEQNALNAPLETTDFRAEEAEWEDSVATRVMEGDGQDQHPDDKHSETETTNHDTFDGKRGVSEGKDVPEGSFSPVGMDVEKVDSIPHQGQSASGGGIEGSELQATGTCLSDENDNIHEENTQSLHDPDNNSLKHAQTDDTLPNDIGEIRDTSIQPVHNEAEAARMSPSPSSELSHFTNHQSSTTSAPALLSVSPLAKHVDAMPFAPGSSELWNRELSRIPSQILAGVSDASQSLFPEVEHSELGSQFLNPDSHLPEDQEGREDAGRSSSPMKPPISSSVKALQEGPCQGNDSVASVASPPLAQSVITGLPSITDLAQTQWDVIEIRPPVSPPFYCLPFGKILFTARTAIMEDIRSGGSAPDLRIEFLPPGAREGLPWCRLMVPQGMGQRVQMAVDESVTGCGAQFNVIESRPYADADKNRQDKIVEVKKKVLSRVDFGTEEFHVRVSLESVVGHRFTPDGPSEQIQLQPAMRRSVEDTMTDFFNYYPGIEEIVFFKALWIVIPVTNGAEDVLPPPSLENSACAPASEQEHGRKLTSFTLGSMKSFTVQNLVTIPFNLDPEIRQVEQSADEGVTKALDSPLPAIHFPPLISVSSSGENPPYSRYSVSESRRGSDSRFAEHFAEFAPSRVPRVEAGGDNVNQSTWRGSDLGGLSKQISRGEQRLHSDGYQEDECGGFQEAARRSKRESMRCVSRDVRGIGPIGPDEHRGQGRGGNFFQYAGGVEIYGGGNSSSRGRGTGRRGPRGSRQFERVQRRGNDSNWQQFSGDVSVGVGNHDPLGDGSAGEPIQHADALEIRRQELTDGRNRVSKRGGRCGGRNSHESREEAPKHSIAPEIMDVPNIAPPREIAAENSQETIVNDGGREDFSDTQGTPPIESGPQSFVATQYVDLFPKLSQSALSSFRAGSFPSWSRDKPDQVMEAIKAYGEVVKYEFYEPDEQYPHHKLLVQLKNPSSLLSRRTPIFIQEFKHPIWIEQEETWDPEYQLLMSARRRRW